MITVFQAKNFRDACMVYDDVKAARELFIKGGYEKVADVDTNDNDVAYEKTNTFMRGWWDYNGVTETEVVTNAGGRRSTSAGDILLDENNVYWLVAMCGFERLPRIDLEDLIERDFINT